MTSRFTTRLAGKRKAEQAQQHHRATVARSSGVLKQTVPVPTTNTVTADASDSRRSKQRAEMAVKRFLRREGKR